MSKSNKKATWISHFLQLMFSKLNDMHVTRILASQIRSYYKLWATLTLCLLTTNWGTTSLFRRVRLSHMKQAWQSGEQREAHIQQHVMLHEHMRLWNESGLAQPWVWNPVFGARDEDVLLNCWTLGAHANTAAAKEFTVSRTQNISKSSGLLLAW